MATAAVALLLAAAAAGATFLGWGIAALRSSWPPRVYGTALLAAAVAMVAISALELVPSALAGGLSVPAVLLWAASGAAVVLLVRWAAGSLGVAGGPLGRSAVVVAVAMGLHNIPEGAVPAAAALISLPGGMVTAAAIGLHNIPEGIAVSAPVLAAGGSRLRALGYTAVSVAGEIIGAVLAVGFSRALSGAWTAGLLALVAGLMTSISVVELFPGGLALVREPAGGCPDAQEIYR